MGKFILNGRNYSGLIDAQGVFIDTDNVITSGTYSASSPLVYTASQDCYVDVECISSEGTREVKGYINGKFLYNTFDSNTSATTVSRELVPLKKGQTLRVETSRSSNSRYTVYGIQMGSEVTFLSEYASACYDTNEREVGCWIDGKPIYQKTITVNSVNLPANDGVDVLLSDYGINDIEKIIDIKGRNETVNAYIPYLAQGGNTLYLITLSSDNPLKIRISRNGGAISNQTFVITVQYTKTTDVAGSGKLTPTAMPTVHYDGNEKVIGTWFGETLYECTVDIGAMTQDTNWYRVSHGIANIQSIVDVKVLAHSTNADDEFIPIPIYRPTSTYGIVFTADKTTFNYLNNWQGSIDHTYVTVQYTKSS